MRVHITYAGGTIGMIDSPQGLVPGADLKGWLFHTLKATQLNEQDISFTELSPLIDSANATPQSWQDIIDDLWAHKDEADAFVVLHGTDTMAYTSAALSYALCDFKKPVILTGSQLPLGLIESDATSNVTGAINAALSGKAQGVTLFFGHHLFWGSRVTKRSSWAFEAFDCPATSPVALTGAPWRWFPQIHKSIGWNEPKKYRSCDIAVIDMAPGISAKRLSAMLDPKPEAVLLRAYGVGNIPSTPEIIKVFEDVIKTGCPVIISSQCQQNVVLAGHYETGAAIAKAGAVGACDMTLEATYAKIAFLLSQGLSGKELSDWMSKSIAHELTPVKEEKPKSKPIGLKRLFGRVAAVKEEMK